MTLLQLVALQVREVEAAAQQWRGSEQQPQGVQKLWCLVLVLKQEELPALMRQVR